MCLKMNRIISIILLALFLAACSKTEEIGVPYFNGPDFTPIWPAEGGDTTSLHKIGAFSFVNQYGEMIDNEDFKGKVYVANFIFTTCGSICPKMTNHMKYVRDELASDSSDLMFLSHSVMPWVDTQEKLKQYAGQMGADQANWHFVTGSKSDIYNIARKEYFIEEEPGYTKDSSEFLHTEHFALIDGQSQIRGIYNGTLQLEMDRLVQDIKFVLAENQ